MTISLKQVLELSEVPLEEATILEWVECGWVKPIQAEGQYLFEEIDVTRIQLVIDLQIRMGVGQDSLSVILSLLDQLYSARAQTRELLEAIAKQPPQVQKAILDRVANEVGQP